MKIKNRIYKSELVEWEKVNDLHSENNLYFISKNGDIKRVGAKILNGRYFTNKADKILKQSISNGYKTVTLFLNGIRKTYYVHRLLANAFIPNIENKPCINHKDGKKFNNDLLNLEWVTYQENTIHAYNTNLKHAVIGKAHHFYGKKNGRERLVFCQNTGYFYDSVKDAANSLKISETRLAVCLRGERPNKTNLIYAN